MDNMVSVIDSFFLCRRIYTMDIWMGIVETVVMFSVLSAFLRLPTCRYVQLDEIQMLARRMMEIKLTAEQKT